MNNSIEKAKAAVLESVLARVGVSLELYEEYKEKGRDIPGYLDYLERSLKHPKKIPLQSPEEFGPWKADEVKRAATIKAADIKQRQDNDEALRRSMILSSRQRTQGMAEDKITISRTLTQLLDVERVKKESELELYPLSPQEEMILDCVVDSASKRDVLEHPEAYVKTKEEITSIVRHPVLNAQAPWRRITEDDIRNITCKIKRNELPGRVIEQWFTSMARHASFHGKCKCGWAGTHYHEIELLHAPLFVEVIVHREGVASQRHNIPEESKKKREFWYRLNQPYAAFIFSDVAKGRFGSFPRGFHLMDWEAQRIGRYYEMFRGKPKGVGFSYSMLLQLLETAEVVDVTQKLNRFECYFRQVEAVMGAVIAKRHRGRKTVFTLKDPLVIAARKRWPRRRPTPS